MYLGLGQVSRLTKMSLSSVVVGYQTLKGFCHSFFVHRRIEHLESLNAGEREPPATLPITDGSRASSQGSLDGIGGATTTAIQLGAPPGAMLSNTLGTTVVVTTSAGSVQQGGPVAHRRGSVSPDEEVQCCPDRHISCPL